jgi:hypothetical protein
MPAPIARADFRRHLVPAGLAPLGPGFVLVDDRITQGLPHRIPLPGELSLLLVVPTGLATAWRDAAPNAVVSSSRDQLTPRGARASASDTGSRPRPATQGQPLVEPLPLAAPARLVVRRARAIAGAVPLAAGCRVVLPDADAQPGVRIELIVREWDIRAGSLRGPGDVGSRIVVAFRRIDLGTAIFGRRES